MDRIEYAAWLARSVPPTRIARVAALRLWRQARRRVGGAIDRPEPVAILRAFGAGQLEELPARLAAPVPGPWAFASPPGVASAARLLRVHLPDQARRMVEQADAVLPRAARVFGRQVQLPEGNHEVPHASAGWRPIDWERDPVFGHRFDGPPPPGADVKFAWMPGRLEETVHLACGAALTVAQPARSAAYVDAALDRVLDLLAAPRGVQWTCAMEVALRAANVAICLRLIAGHPAAWRRAAALLVILQGLVEHLQWVEAHLEDDTVVPNNHLVSDRVGQTVVGALLPRLPGAFSLGRRAAGALERLILEQTLDDGFSFEGSVFYHRLATELFLLGDLAAAGLSAPMGASSRQRLAQMFEACDRLVVEGGRAPQIGDNDSGTALPFVWRAPTEMAHLPPIGAAHLGRPVHRCFDPPAELVWLLGASGLRAFQDRPLARQVRRDDRLPAGGIAILRSRRFSCAIACGPNGTGGTGTHGHNDKLSVEVRLDGRLLVADPGTGSYTGDPALRNRLRGTAAHSTVILDGQEQQPLPRGRLFALPERAWARCLGFESQSLRARFVGEHRGWERLPGSPIHRRSITLDKLREVLLIEDALEGGGFHRGEARFLLAADEVEVRPLAPDERARAEALLPARAWDLQRAVAIGGGGLLLAAGCDAPRIEGAIRARGYGELRDARHVCFPFAGTLPIVIAVAFLPPAGAPGRGEEA